MSLLIDSQARAALSPERAAQICAAWASSGEFGEYVVYERGLSWVFAAGVASRIVLTRDEIVVTDNGEQTVSRWEGDPAGALERALDSLQDASWRVYGWVGFDFCAPRFDLVDRIGEDTVLAHLIVPRFEAFIDAAGVDTGDADPATAVRLRVLAGRVAEPAPPTGVNVIADPDDYRDRAAQAINEIEAGRYQKVILSRRVEIPFEVDIPATYARGRASNNPARSYLLELGDLQAAGFSPEIVVATKLDGTVVSHPLAGTRAFGRSDELDSAARAELLADPKEIAEHAISVQAAFEEIDSVSIPGSTALSEFMAVRERGSVQHLASTVRGKLAPENGPWRALAATFPAITASGIPKAQAVDAIYRLEPHRRGLYSGAVVAASSHGDLEATLTLRSVFSSAGESWLRAGAGVVAQSTPEREFEETCEKLASVAPYVVARSQLVQ